LTVSVPFWLYGLRKISEEISRFLDRSLTAETKNGGENLGVKVNTTVHIESPQGTVPFRGPMDDGGVWGRDVESRLDSLEQFGFPRSEMDVFVREHEASMEERLAWLEDRRATASEIEDRLIAYSQHAPHIVDSFEAFRGALDDPFSIEDIYVRFERHMREIASWEPAMNRWRQVWFEHNLGDSWALLYRRLAALDASSYGAVEPLHRLFEFPERFDEVFRHLQTVEEDEKRQRNMIQAVITELNAHGYDVSGVEELPLLESLARLDRWQSFHARREQLRLSIVQWLQPFDSTLALEMEQRCNALAHLNQQAALTELQTEVNALAQTLEERRKALSARIEDWRLKGIAFPHEGALHPSDLMEWEANHEVVAQSVEVHLALVERWKRFNMYWPSRTMASMELVGQLDQTSALQDAVDELDALWKKAELDGLDVLQGYEHAGLDVTDWRQRVFEDPLNALERMMALRSTWDRRVGLMAQLRDLDVSFSGNDEAEVRLVLLANEELENDILDEIEGFVKRAQRRHERHRIMLEEELANMRRAGVLPVEVRTERMSLQELEVHVATMQTQRTTTARGGNSVMTPTLVPALKQELQRLQEVGWAVQEWISRLEDDPVVVARSLSAARPFIQQHDVLRRRLQRLPWQRDITLASQVELQLNQPQRLAALMGNIPTWAAHLSQCDIEDAEFVFTAWQPTQLRPTLVPVPESTQRPVLQPTTVLDDAHEAMLEAMEQTQTTMEVAEEFLPVSTSKPHAQLEEVRPEPQVAMVHPSEEVSPAATMSHEEHQPLDRGIAQHAQPTMKSEEVSASEDSDIVAPQTAPLGDGTSATNNALQRLSELISLVGFSDLASDINNRGLEAMQEIRRRLAQHVNVQPRDVRIGRLLRLTLRLLPVGDEHDEERALMLGMLCEMVPPLKRWIRRRLEARHSGAKGHFLNDARDLGIALERIPGLGRRVPLDGDEWPLPHDLEGLKYEVQRLQKAVHLPSAGGVQA
jgi:hypothetical protein